MSEIALGEHTRIVNASRVLYKNIQKFLVWAYDSLELNGIFFLPVEVRLGIIDRSFFKWNLTAINESNTVLERLTKAIELPLVRRWPLDGAIT